MKYDAVFLVFYALVFCCYFVNRIEPTVMGLSFVYFYSLLVWVFGMSLLVLIAKFVWR